METKGLQNFFWSVRSNRAFEAFVIVVIIASALLVGAKTYNISGNWRTVIYVLDWIITLIFLTEISVRFLGEKRKLDFFKQGWNIFDTLIVVASLVPIEDSDMALVGRLIRIFRVLRLISIIPEMRILMNALIKALPQLGYVLVLMFIIFYIYGAIGSMLFAEINPALWGDIARAMLTLFRVMTFEDWTDVMYETMVLYPLSWSYYLSFIFLSAFAFLNMVIGIVVNVLNEENDRVMLEEQGLTKVSLNEIHTQLNDIQSMLALAEAKRSNQE
ncbi:ion transporter [Halieaceae bacterium IMCC14734]|uniref:Ion transporter n=1 Tax=Candidatus Litorirhabdus singularis TaxID=2518993 RepID=A0ABT3TBN1_9GAMM|nr:ion transporter [Candidatus Litorirhabdus singularis]MCX2979701.1 ion transporter [Candidatus Litorirhabdus singularis]